MIEPDVTWHGPPELIEAVKRATHREVFEHDFTEFVEVVGPEHISVSPEELMADARRGARLYARWLTSERQRLLRVLRQKPPRSNIDKRVRFTTDFRKFGGIYEALRFDPPDLEKWSVELAGVVYAGEDGLKALRAKYGRVGAFGKTVPPQGWQEV